jgi:hypothetical protein
VSNTATYQRDPRQTLNTSMRPPFDLTKLRAAHPDGFYDQARLAKLPRRITCTGLHEERLGQSRFCQELQARRQWIAANCSGGWAVQPVRDSMLRLTGRTFCFADPDEAFHFKLRFPTRL